MSIKSLFQNIADAIKNVYGTSDTFTPAQMPQAITNFNSIFQKKVLSSPIGSQTTVEGCLSSLSSDLSELRVIGYVTADGVKTVSQLLDALFPLIKDNHRLAQSVLIMSDSILHPRQLNQNNLVYFNGNISNDVYVEIANIQASNSVYASKDANSGVVNMSSTVPASGTVYKVCI